jgi:hypothetical protein
MRFGDGLKQKAVRGLTALQSTACEIFDETQLLSRSFWSAMRPRVALKEHLLAHKWQALQRFNVVFSRRHDLVGGSRHSNKKCPRSN